MAHSGAPLCLVRSSINIDQMFAVPHVVRPGETLSSSAMQSRPGGKGANVSAAVALAGQDVIMSGAVGRDAEWPIDQLAQRGVKTEAIRVFDDVPTGRAFIQVAADGENSIVLLKGANFHPDPQADDPAKVFSSLPSQPTHLILQNEIPLATTKAFLRHARTVEPRCTTIFNPSPMLIGEEVRKFGWNEVDVLIVNEGEGQDLLEALGQAELNTDSDVLEALAKLDVLQHTSWIVVTKGARGVSAYVRAFSQASGRQRIDVPAAKPKAVQDTTGAGDTFAGNLVAGLMRAHGQGGEQVGAADSANDVLRWAGAAAAVAVERNGAMESIPKFADVKKREKELLG